MEPTLATSSASRSQLYSVPTAPAEVPIITTCSGHGENNNNNNYNNNSKLLTSSATSSQVLATRSSMTALMMLFPATHSNPGSLL